MRRSVASWCCLAFAAVLVGHGAELASAKAGAAELGAFSAPFTEPTINGVPAKEKCVEHKTYKGDPQPNKKFDCKPAAVTLAVLGDGRALYYNGIEGSEEVEYGVLPELGQVSANDQTRLLNLSKSGPKWSVPSPERGGLNPDGYESEYLVPGGGTTETYNDGGMFCADATFLPDGRLMVAGGTAWYSDPGVDGAPYGVLELEGLRSVNFFNPKTNRWTQGRDMNYGRWYPTMVTLGDGKTFIASGVQKLIKPVYPTHATDSGRNVLETETFDPKTGKWTYNGTSADKSLPLFPRLHLLPNGQVLYNAAGQVFNPAGEAYDEVLWNLASSYDPKTKTWTDLGIPGMGTMAPGFRGSSFSLMLPLDPKDGYSKARFLSAGGIMGVTPGSYVANPFSAISTVDTKLGNAMSTVATGDLNEARWYSTGAVLPTGDVVAFNGGDRDEVLAPGTAFPTNRTVMFDQKTMEWRAVATSGRFRTYHNTAALLPDGRVLVGGHAPIQTLDGSHRTLPGGFSPNDGRDPSFEIFSPPYLFWGARPKITGLSGSMSYGKRFTITTGGPASKIASVALVRNTSITHLVDGDQRVVELKIVSRSGNKLTVAMAPNGNVVPPGPYMLFVNGKSSKGSIPSVAKQVIIR